MAKETVVDYETTEVERTETYCDVCGGKMEEDEEEHIIVVDPEITGQHMPESPPTIQELADKHSSRSIRRFRPSSAFGKEEQIWAAFLEVYNDLYDARTAQADMWGGVMYEHTCSNCVESISDGEMPEKEHIGRVRSGFEANDKRSLKTRVVSTYRVARSTHPFLSSIGPILIGLVTMFFVIFFTSPTLVTVPIFSVGLGLVFLGFIVLMSSF